MTLTPGQSQYAYPGREQCNVFSIPMILENNGRPVNGIPPKLFWSREFLDQSCPATGPSDQYPGEPGEADCNYWEYKAGSIEGVAPWTLMDSVTLDENYLTFTWNDCFYKFGAINTLYPPGSQIIISFSKRISDGNGLVYDPTGSGYGDEQAEDGTGSAGTTWGAQYWAGCVQFVTDQYDRDSDAEDGPGELKLRINQFRSVLRGSEAVTGEGDPTYWQKFCNGFKRTCGYPGAPGGETCNPERYDIEFNFDEYEGSSEDSTNDALYRFGKDLTYAYYVNLQRILAELYDETAEDPYEDIFPILKYCLTENTILRLIDPLFPDTPLLPPTNAEDGRGCVQIGIMMDVRICTEAGGRIT